MNNYWSLRKKRQTKSKNSSELDAQVAEEYDNIVASILNEKRITSVSEQPETEELYSRKKFQEIFNKELEIKWVNNIKLYLKYRIEHGNTSVKIIKYNGVFLAFWIKYQELLGAEGTLPYKREKMLKKIGVLNDCYSPNELKILEEEVKKIKKISFSRSDSIRR